MAKKSQKRSKRQSRAKKLADLVASRQAKNVKGGSPSLTSSAPPPSRSGEGRILIPLYLQELQG